MPLTPKGKEIMANMEKEYKDPKKAKEVFYASANKGTITGVHNDRRDCNMSNDVESPKPASGPMSTKGPVGTSEGLPKTVTPTDYLRDAEPCGKGMSLDAIKEMGKRIGKY